MFYQCTEVLVDTCTSWALVDVIASFDALGITSSEVLEWFGWGMGSVILFLTLGLAFGSVLRLVREMGKGFE